MTTDRQPEVGPADQPDMWIASGRTASGGTFRYWAKTESQARQFVDQYRECAIGHVIQGVFE